MLAADTSALLQVLLIAIVLAGDNAVVVGMAAAGVSVVGPTLAGGLLLLWVCWRMFRDFRQHEIGGDPEAIGDPAKGRVARAGVFTKYCVLAT